MALGIKLQPSKLLDLVLCVELSIHSNHRLIVTECPSLFVLAVVLAGIFKHPLA